MAEETAIGTVTGAETAAQTPEKSEFVELVELLCGFMKLMSDADARRIVAKEKLFAKNKMMRFNTLFRSLGDLSRVYSVIRHDSQLFIENREKYAKDVEAIDKDAAKIVRELKVHDTRELQIITTVLGWINRIVKFETKMSADAKNAGIEKMKSYIPQLEAEPFNDKESAEALKKVIEILDGSEVEVLETFIEDARHWLQWRRHSGGQGIDFFIGRVRQFLHGAEGVKGLEKDFKDNDVVKRIKQNDAVVNLATFKKQIELFDNIFNYLKQIIETKAWTADFKTLDGKVVKMPFLGKNGFYYNLTKGENYIGMVEDKFGNKKFGKLLREFEKKTHEQPEKWREEFAKLERVLKDPKYEEENIIMPAARELEQIFTKRVEEIKKGKDKQILVHKKVLEKKKKDIDNASNIASKDFKKIVMKKRSKTYKRWERVKSKFTDWENNVMALSVRFFREIKDIEPWLNFMDSYAYVKKQHGVKHAMSKFLAETIPKFARSGQVHKAIAPYVGGLTYAGGILADKEEEIIDILNQMRQDNPSLVMKLKILVPKARIIYRRYERLLKLIDSFEEEYTEEGKTPKEIETPEAAAVARPANVLEAANESREAAARAG